MPLQATSGAASYDAFGGGVAAVPNYIEECFSTFLYQGNGSTQTITNGIDLAGKGGLVWYKSRDATSFHRLTDTARGPEYALYSNATNAQQAIYEIDSFNSNGFTTTGFGSGEKIVSWTFREQPKFFDVVTFTFTSGSPFTFNHSLGSTPGCIIFKRTDNVSNWITYHRGLNGNVSPNQWNIKLNTTAAQYNEGFAWLTSITSTSVTISTDYFADGGTYVAYLFAHNAGGFGLSGTDNVISCGSYTGTGATLDVNLGYEVQFVLIKPTSVAGNWTMMDNMRGMTQVGVDGTARLRPNTSEAESALGGSYGAFPNATGFTVKSNPGVDDYNASGQTYIYIAIRRGPMKVPETGTSVFGAGTRSGSGSVAKTNSNILTDLTFIKNRTSGGEYWAWTPRLVGNLTLQSNSTDAELTGAMATNPWDTMTGAFCAASNGATNSGSLIDYSFRRAPGFHDVVCDTGTGAVKTVTHNLGVAPELMIRKSRTDGTREWVIYSAALGATQVVFFNPANAAATSSGSWNNTAPTASVFTVGSNNNVNLSGGSFVSYLFASCPGVSRVGTFTGTGATQVINCGFTAGARFVLIKATSTTGNWLVWDSARGIVAGNDPYLALNSTAAEVTGTDWVDTAATGFELSNAGGNLANSSGVSYVFFAVA